MDSVLNSQYFNDPNGLSGNEDCGQMSAWFVLNSIGFYQVTPGKPLYSIGRPLFNKATINLPNGNKFTVIAKNNSRTNKYIKKITLNGKELTKPFFTHEELMKGGTLTLEMSSTK
jgi:putative alpha-1,2-mannosidase